MHVHLNVNWFCPCAASKSGPSDDDEEVEETGQLIDEDDDLAHPEGDRHGESAVADQDTKNIFLDCHLVRRRSTMAEAELIAIKDMFCPATGPQHSTNPRNFCKETRNHQALGGLSVPTVILESIFCRQPDQLIHGLKSTDSVMLSHWSPRDGCWELAALSLGTRNNFPKVCTFSAAQPSCTLPAIGRLRKEFLDDWKQMSCPGAVNRWVPQNWPRFESDAHPTEPAAAHAAKVEQTKPTLTLVQWSNEPPFKDKKGTSLPKVSMPQSLRAKWQNDPLRSEQWASEVKQFDSALQEAIVVPGPQTEPEPQEDPSGTAESDAEWKEKTEDAIRQTHEGQESQFNTIIIIPITILRISSNISLC